MKSKIVTLFSLVGILGLCGVLSRGMVMPVRAELRLWQPASRIDSLAGGLGQGMSLGLLGGLRALVADFFWLRVNMLWEKRDLDGTRHNLRLATAADPRPLLFWLNGARMMAYDMPAWRMAALGEAAGSSAETRRSVEAEQVQLALAWLDEAAAFHPGSPALLIERANLCLNCQHDLEAAAVNYRLAAEQPGAPYYAARLHAELLRRLGRKAEALAWLVQWHPRLPPDDEAAAASVVLARIRDLERELAVPDEQRYQPTNRPGDDARPASEGGQSGR